MVEQIAMQLRSSRGPKNQGYIEPKP